MFLWVDDKEAFHVNRAFRVHGTTQLLVHLRRIVPPLMNLSILEITRFEQTFKNALTTLQMGGGKGGSELIQGKC